MVATNAASEESALKRKLAERVSVNPRLKDTAFLTFLGQNPPFELKRYSNDLGKMTWEKVGM
jgi:hypothetical protein